MTGETQMTRCLAPMILALSLFVSTQAIAEELTVTLAVQNMFCAACPHTVKASLQRVPGVIKVVVSFENKTAVVIYDDTKTGVDALAAATTNAGYPSAPKG
jgi:mercuric ion binding protein